MNLLEWFRDFFIEHWPAFAWAVCGMIIGQVMKTSVFTREQAYKVRKLQPFWWWMRKTLPLHPMIAGLFVGLLWVDPEGRGWSYAPSMGYFFFAGGGSVVIYQVLKGLFKSKKIPFDPDAIGVVSEKPPAHPMELPETD